MAADAPLTGPGLAVRRLQIADKDVVWLRSILEGYDGLANLCGDGKGNVTLICTESRSRELDNLLADLSAEQPGRIEVCDG